jgi:choline dehydrogenase
VGIISRTCCYVRRRSRHVDGIDVVSHIFLQKSPTCSRKSSSPVTSLKGRENMIATSSDLISQNYDHIIVGGGSAGCLIAARLSADSARRVLLIEAGGADIDQPSIDDPTRWFSNLGSEVDWQYRTVPQRNANGRIIDFNRGKVLGGSSSINATVWVWGHPTNFDQWASEGNVGWDFASLSPIFQSLESSPRATTGRGRGQTGPMRLTATSADLPIAQVFFEACREIGYPILDDVNGPVAEGCGTYDLNVVDGRRYSAARALLLPVARRPNLTILSCAEVEALRLEKNRCVGVRCRSDGRVQEFRSDREVILCAGAIGSPHLLMKSGIGNATDLQRVGIKVELDLPGVGENLQDHCLIRVYAAETREIFRSQRHPDAHLYLRSNNALPAPDIEIIMSSSATGVRDLPDDRNFVLTTTLLRPLSRGRLALGTSDGPIQIDPRYLSHEQDLDAMCVAVEKCNELSLTTALSRREARRVRSAPREKAAMRDFLRANVGTYWHPVGTCAMGIGEQSVVDPSLRVRGVSNLRIADSSVMPSITTGNTLAPTLVIAERAARLILANAKE